MWGDSRPEAEATSPSASPRLRQTRLTATPSLGQPRPASAMGSCLPAGQPLIPAVLPTPRRHTALRRVDGDMHAAARQHERLGGAGSRRAVRAGPAGAHHTRAESLLIWVVFSPWHFYHTHSHAVLFVLPSRRSLYWTAELAACAFFADTAVRPLLALVYHVAPCLVRWMLLSINLSCSLTCFRICDR